MGDQDAAERDGADVLRAQVVALLRCRQQGVEHLDGRLEHLHELEDALVGAVQAAGEAVGVGVALAEHLELADVDLADEGGDVLVVVVAGFGLGDGDLAAAGRVKLDDAEPLDVAIPLLKPLQGPGAGQAGDDAAWDAVLRLQGVSHGLGVEQAERALEHRA